VPYIGLFFIAGRFLCLLLDRSSASATGSRMAIFGVIIVAALACAAVSHERAVVWRNTFTLFDDAVRKGPPAPIPLKNRGMAYYYAGDYRRAIDDFTQSIALYSGDYETFLNRGASQFALADYRAALSDFETAARLKPGNANVLLNSASALAMLGDGDKALDLFTKAISTDPLNASARCNRGRLFLATGDTAAACADWRTARDLGSPKAQAMLDRYCR
jgi:tetratricopeptide (TPR) repeat protein